MGLDFSRIANFIMKPPTEFGAGTILFTAVWGFAKGLQSFVNSETSHQVSESLRGLRTGTPVRGLQQGFQAMFGTVFGRTASSLKRLLWALVLAAGIAALAVASHM